VNELTVTLRDTLVDELPRIAALEVTHGGGFILSYPLERHHREFARPDTLYNTVYCNGDFVGFVILVLDPDGHSIEFRRIVIAESGKGLGKAVVHMVSDLARRLGRARAWLDVFENNARARHVYEQCGYRQFGRSTYAGRDLLLYESML
jgi:diamine N-acetyltransferase